MGLFLFIDGPALVCGWVNFPILWPHTPVQMKLKSPPRAFYFQLLLSKIPIEISLRSSPYKTTIISYSIRLADERERCKSSQRKVQVSTEGKDNLKSSTKFFTHMPLNPLDDILQCTEHPPVYCTDIMQGESGFSFFVA